MFSTKEDDRDPAKVDGLFADFIAELDRWDGYLREPDAHGRGGGPYLAGSEFSRADAALYPVFAFPVRLGYDPHVRHPGLAAWYDRIIPRPSVQASWPPHWKDSAPWDLGFAERLGAPGSD